MINDLYVWIMFIPPFKTLKTTLNLNIQIIWQDTWRWMTITLPYCVTLPWNIHFLSWEQRVVIRIGWFEGILGLFGRWIGIGYRFLISVSNNGGGEDLFLDQVRRLWGSGRAFIAFWLLSPLWLFLENMDVKLLPKWYIP